MEGFLYQATIYLVAAVVAVPIAARLGFGSVLGYLAAGIIIGPVLGWVGSETATLQHVAEFGVVMMLFLIGLELEPRALWDMRHRLLGLGGLQIVLTTMLLTAAIIALGENWQTALALGLALSLSSTAIVLQTLSEKGLMQTGGGRSAFSVLLTQDIAVIPILAFLPLLVLAPMMQIAADGSISRPGIEQTEAATDGAPQADHGTDAPDAEHGAGYGGEMAHGPDLSLVDGLPGWGVTLVTIGIVAAIILAGIYLTRPVFRFIHATRLREMYTALALFIVVGISFLMTLIGLSPALGAFLAGVVLASSEFRHELESDLEPFKGLLLGLFFITVGAGFNVNAFFASALDLMGLAILVTVLKGLILFGLALAFRLRGRDKWLFTLGLAQAGEFGFVLVAFSLQQNVLTPQIADRALMVIALSMMITPLLFILFDVLSRRIVEARPAPLVPDKIDAEGPVIIAGIGRFGQIVNRLVQASGFKTVVLDHDMETIQLMRRFGFKGFLGDPTRPELLKAAGIGKARVLVAAMDEPDQVTKLVRYARRERPDLHIVARAYDRNHVYQLYQAGADDIVREMFDSSLRAGRYVLENIGLSEFEASEAEQTFYAHDRYTVRQLAEVWDPNVPATDNAAYIARARELQKELETALLSRASENEKKSA